MTRNLSHRASDLEPVVSLGRFEHRYFPKSVQPQIKCVQVPQKLILGLRVTLHSSGPLLSVPSQVPPLKVKDLSRTSSEPESRGPDEESRDRRPCPGRSLGGSHHTYKKSGWTERAKEDGDLGDPSRTNSTQRQISL